MVYTKQFDEKKYLDIQEILDKMQLLSAGEEIISSVFETSSQLSHCRWLLYDFLAHMGMKRSFRIVTDTYNNCLRIRRIETTRPIKVSAHRTGIHPALEPMLAEFVSLDDLTKAERKLSEWVDARRVNPAELGILLTELRRVMT